MKRRQSHAMKVENASKLPRARCHATHNSITQRNKLFTGLASDKCLFKARPVLCQTEDKQQIRARRPCNAKKDETIRERVNYKPPVNGTLISVEDERHDIGKLILNSPPFHGYAVPMARILDVLAGTTHVPGAPYVTKSEHHRHDVIFAQGATAAPGAFFICDGHVTLFRRSDRALMDHMQHKLFVIGAFPEMADDQSNALRKPKSSEKEWELAKMGPGSLIGLGGMVRGGYYVDTARAHLYCKLIFFPADVLSARLLDVKASVLKWLVESAESRNRQFARVQALFENEPSAEDKTDKTPRLSIDWQSAKSKPMDTGLKQVTPLVLKAEGEKRYFHSRGSDVAFAGPYPFKPGQVPQINSDLLASSSDRTSFQFVNTRKSFSRSREPGSGPDMRLPSACEMPGTRVGRLYHRLWDNCTPSTLNMLLDMQVLDETDETSSMCNPVSPRPMVQKLKHAFLEQQREVSPNAALITNVPRLDLYRTLLQTPDSPRSLTERPTTEPGRSRSEKYKITNLREAVPLIVVEHRRPLTSRPTATDRYADRFASRFHFPLARANSAARRSIAWSGTLDRENRPPSEYIARKPLTLWEGKTGQ